MHDRPTCPPFLSRARRLCRCAALGAVLFAAPALAGAATPFAATPPAAPFAAPGEGMPLTRVLIALLLVLAAVYAAAKLSRRAGVAAGSGAARLEILAQTTLGPRERAVLLRVGGQDVLLGVAPGNVRLLLELPARAESGGSPPATPDAAGGSAEPARPNFRELLLRSLGR